MTKKQATREIVLLWLNNIIAKDYADVEDIRILKTLKETKTLRKYQL